jgi:hypothetical protein
MDKLTPYTTGHFSVPNEVANAADVPLTHEEFRIYIMICRFASSYKKVFPSYAKIREHCAIGSNATVKKALNGLAEKGLLHIKPQKRKGTNAKSSNLYTLLKPQVKRKNTDENECPVCGGSTVEHEHKKTPASLENTGVDGIGCSPAVQGLFTGCTRVVQPVNKGCSPAVQEIIENKYIVSKEREGAAPPGGGQAAAHTQINMPKNERKPHGEFKNVMLTSGAYEALLVRFGEERTAGLIKQLDTKKGSQSYKSADDYITLIRFAEFEDQRAKAAAEAKPYVPKKNSFNSFSQRGIDFDKYAELDRLISLGDTEGAARLRRELGLEIEGSTP